MSFQTEIPDIDFRELSAYEYAAWWKFLVDFYSFKYVYWHVRASINKNAKNTSIKLVIRNGGKLNIFLSFILEFFPKLNRYRNGIEILMFAAALPAERNFPASVVYSTFELLLETGHLYMGKVHKWAI